MLLAQSVLNVLRVILVEAHLAKKAITVQAVHLYANTLAQQEHTELTRLERETLVNACLALQVITAHKRQQLQPLPL